MVFVVQEGKTGYRWWLWVFLGEDIRADLRGWLLARKGGALIPV
jgi:hypothetical protein